MVAPSATVKRFAPAARPRVAVAGDGTLAAIQEPTRIVVAEVSSCSAFAELVTAGDADESEVAWVGTPPRLLVLSRYATCSTVHLVDPFGPRTISELRLDAPMKLCAAVGNHALAIGAQSAIVLAASDTGITPSPFRARAIPSTVGAAGALFLVTVAGGIEEWDPQTRLPKRRFKLPRRAEITALGGNERVVWMTTKQEPARIDVIPLAARGQPTSHELQEPIAHVAAHPRSDLLACIGATSGRIWVIDLDGRVGLRMVGPEGIDRVESIGLVVGRTAGLLAAQANRPLAVVTLERSEAPVSESYLAAARDASPPPHAPLVGRDGHGEAQNTMVTLSLPPAQATRPVPAAPVAPAPKSVSSPVTRPVEDPAFSSFRERVQHPRANTAEPVATLWPDAPVDWRDEVVAWTREVMESELSCPLPIEAMLARFDVTPSLAPALVLLYGAHLVGADGVAPVEIARVAGWPEALGRGELAAKQLATYGGSRVRLATAVQRALDELPPLTGTLIGTSGVVSLLAPCTIVASGPLPIVANACLTSIGGAILAAHDDADPSELVAEARAYGAAPMLRATASALEGISVEQPIILVAADERTADSLGLPRLS